MVDNASSDGTPDYLRKVEKEHDNVTGRPQLETNKGYAGGNNDGMRAATGDCVVLLNNDTLVTPGWLDALLTPLERDRSIGLICPVTNSAGNEQMMVIPSLNEENYVEVSGRYTSEEQGASLRHGEAGLLLRGHAAGRDGQGRNAGREVRPGHVRGRRLLFSGEERPDIAWSSTRGASSITRAACPSRSWWTRSTNRYSRGTAHYYEKKHGQPWLFNDLTLAFYSQMRRELEAHPEEGPRLSGGRAHRRPLERLRVPDPARQGAGEGRGAGQRHAQGPQVLSAFLAMFRDEYLKGDKRSRLLFRRKVRRKLQSIEEPGGHRPPGGGA